jgi:hypothetical protein
MPHVSKPLRHILLVRGEEENKLLIRATAIHTVGHVEAKLASIADF